MRNLNNLGTALVIGAVVTLNPLVSPMASADAEPQALTNVKVYHRCTLPPGQSTDSVPSPEITAKTIRPVEMKLVAFPPGKGYRSADGLDFRYFEPNTDVKLALDPGKYRLMEGETIGLGLVSKPDRKGVITIFANELVTAGKCQY